MCSNSLYARGISGIVCGVTDICRVSEASTDAVQLISRSAGGLGELTARMDDGTAVRTAVTRKDGGVWLTWHVNKAEVQDFLRERIAGVMEEGMTEGGLWAGVGDDKFLGQFSEGEILLGQNAAGKLRGYYPCDYVGDLLRDGVPVALYKIGATSAGELAGETGNVVTVARKGEISEALAHCRDRREANKPAVICIHGEPGIGKSQLAATLCEEIRKTDDRGHKDRYHRSGRGGDKLSAISSRSKDLGSRLAGMESYFRAEGKDSVWWLDDVHWAPREDQALLGALAASRDISATVILTTRPKARDIFAGHATLNLFLAPFTSEEAADLIREVSGYLPDEATLREIIRCTAGSPLMIHEFVMSALAAGTLRAIKGRLAFKHEPRRMGKTLELRQIVENTLSGLPGNATAATKALAVLRGGIAESQIPAFLQSCGLAPVSGSDDLQPYFLRVENQVECRHELIREALVSLLPVSAGRYHRAAMECRRLSGNWIEAYHHACQLGDTSTGERSSMIAKAFDQAWETGLLKQCETLGHIIHRKRLPLAATPEFGVTMGKVFYRMGKMRECARWMRRVSAVSRRFHWLGIASYFCRPLRGSELAGKYRTASKRLADAYHLQADAHWTFRELRTSAACLLKAVSVTGSMAYPNAERSEAQAGLAIILSATPLKKTCHRFISNSLREAAASGRPVREMRVRMLCAIALLGTDRWREAIGVCESAHRWAEANGEVKLQLQAGLPLTAALSFLNERDQANKLAAEQMELAVRSQDEYLTALTRGVKAALALNEQNAAVAARILHGMPEIPAVATEQAMLDSVLRYMEEDFEGAMERLARLMPLLREGPPSNYGVSTLFDLPLSASLGMWGRGMVPWHNVRAILKAFKRQASAFVVARPLFTAWQAVVDSCAKGSGDTLRRGLERAMHEAVRRGFSSHGSSIRALATAFGVGLPNDFPVFAGELGRIRKMKRDIEHRIPN